MGIVPEFLGGTPDVHYAKVVFGGEIAIDAYQFPDGEIRYSITGACLLVGLGKNYLSDLQVRGSSPERLKALQNKGFTGSRRTRYSTIGNGQLSISPQRRQPRISVTSC